MRCNACQVSHLSFTILPSIEYVNTSTIHTEKHFNFGCKVFFRQLIITQENFSVFLDHFFLVLKGTVYDSNVSLLQINRSFDDNFQTAHALPAAVFSGRYGGAMTS